MTTIKNRRWMKSALAEAKTCNVAMPWVRGPRRAAMLARRAENAARPALLAAPIKRAG